MTLAKATQERPAEPPALDSRPTVEHPHPGLFPVPASLPFEEPAAEPPPFALPVPDADAARPLVVAPPLNPFPLVPPPPVNPFPLVPAPPLDVVDPTEVDPAPVVAVLAEPVLVVLVLVAVLLVPVVKENAFFDWTPTEDT